MGIDDQIKRIHQHTEKDIKTNRIKIMKQRANKRTSARAHERTSERANERTSERANERTSERANGRTFKSLVHRGMTRKVSVNKRATKLNCANNDRVGEKVKEANVRS